MPEPRILLLHTYYPEFLEELYRSHPELDDLDSQSQRRKVMGTGFALGDAYAVGFRSAGAVADEVIVNADRMQACWASEHGLTPTGNIHDRRRQIVAAQVKHHSPDVLYVFEWSPLGDAFLREIKPHVRLLVGQMSSPLRPERDYSAVALLVSAGAPGGGDWRGGAWCARHIGCGRGSRWACAFLHRLDLPEDFGDQERAGLLLDGAWLWGIGRDRLQG